MDDTDFGQIAIYNKLFNNATGSSDTVLDCLYGKKSYCGMFNSKRLPIMIGSKLHTCDENPLNINGYFIIDGICKTVSSLYVIDKMPYTKDRAYLTDGTRVSILSFGKYKVFSGNTSTTWFLPNNYHDITQYSNKPTRLLEHLNISHSLNKQRFTRSVGPVDAAILCGMFEAWLGIKDAPEQRYRLVTPGELIHDAITRGHEPISCFKTHTWPVKNILNIHSVSEDMKHYSMLGDIEAVRRITFPTIRENTTLSKRLVKHSNRKKICPVQTSEGSLCGTVLYLTQGATVTDEEDVSYSDTVESHCYMLFINGKFVDNVSSIDTNADVVIQGKLIMVWSSMGRIKDGHSDVSVCAGYIPYRTCNPAVRAMFACAMLKQAISVDPRTRDGMFHDTKYLISGEQPLIGPPFPYPCGWNLTVGIMPWYGYNIEDAIVVSESTARKYTTEKYAVYKAILGTLNDTILETFVDVGSIVTKGMLLFTAFHPREITTIEMVRADISGYVSCIVEHEACYSVKVCYRRILEVGDKMTSRHGQKGVVSLVVPDKDMPKYLVNSEWKPIELLINPHAFPSRMTMGQLHEMGKTTFRVKIPEYGEVLKPIIVGKCYYMALRHQVADKVQWRADGMMNKLSGQAMSGKANQGGLRFGHMERDVLLAVGDHAILHELFSIDMETTWTCDTCGIIGRKDACIHDRNETPIHRHTLICLGYMRALGKDILYWPNVKEYSIVKIDISRFPEIKRPEEMNFGETDILDIRYCERPGLSKDEKKIVPVLPAILRTNNINMLYTRMFSKKNYDDIIKAIFTTLAGKNGTYHKYVEGKRVNNCVRSVIVPRPNIPVDTVELPLGTNINSSNGILNRQPSLSSNSLMFAKLVIGSNKTIGINPQLCKAFNADFDGDEMNVFGTDNITDRLPPRVEPVQDYILGTCEEVTHMGLTATVDDMQMMVDKKSKGKPFNIEHMFIRIGDVMVAGEKVGTIEGCYFVGLTDDEWYLQSMAAREGAASIGVNTPFTGDLNATCNKAYI
jgi:hypothetical protein